MRKWIYTTFGQLGKVTTEADGDIVSMESGTVVYVAAEVDALLASHVMATDQSNLEALHARIAGLESLLRRCRGNLYHPHQPAMIDELEQEIDKSLMER
jgi:hypothetical protein